MSMVLRSWREARAGARTQDIEHQIECALVARRYLDPRIQLVILVATNLMATTPRPFAIDVVSVLSAAAVLIYCERLVSAIKWLIGYAIILVTALLCVISVDPFFLSFGAMLMMACKMYAIAMLAVNLILTVRAGELACALQRIHTPRLMIVALSVALRFFPTLAAEASAVIDAMKLRGVRLSLANIVRHPLKMIEYFAVPLMLRVSVVTDEISRAATVRGIDSKHRRTSLYALRIGVADLISLLGFCVLTIISIVFAQDGFTFMGLF